MRTAVQVDWGGWAYKVTPEQIRKYNEETGGRYPIPDCDLNPDKQYAIIDVEIY